MHLRALDIRTLFNVLMLGMAVAEGGCYGTPRSDVPDGGGGLGGIGAGDGGAALSITSPPSPTYTNANVTVEVSVGVPATSGVQVLKDGNVLVELSGPSYAFVWDTTKEDEGSYQIVAQMVVDGQIVTSEPVTIFVDRTPPAIVSSVPASGETNVSLTDPIRVVFSETLAPTSVTSDSVRLAFGTASVNATARLAAGGKTIEVAIADRSSIVLPGSMTETVAATITDLASNSFTGATWSASVPVWVDMGTIVGIYPQMVLGAAGEPIVVTGSGTLRIARYSGGRNWDTSIPSPQMGATSQDVSTFGIAAAQNGDLFVTWIDSSSVQVARWTGAAWDRLWTSPGGGRVRNPAVAINDNKQPVVYWVTDPQGNTFYYQSNVSAWTGTGWISFPGLPMGPCNSVPCRLILDKAGFPAVEVGSRLFRWSASSWIGPSGSSLASLALNASNQVLSVQDTETTLQVVALSSQGGLTNYVPVLSEPAIASIPMKHRRSQSTASISPSSSG